MEPLALLGALPRVGARRLAVRVTPDALRQVRAGHPWVYDRSLTSVSHDGAPGDLAVVFDEKRRFAAIGLWDPTSPIRIRILQRGEPRSIDDAHWAERILLALDRRRPLLDDPETTAYRCLNGESDGVPGLVADRYDDVLVVKLYTPGWFPHLSTFLPVLVEATGARAVVLRLARTVAAGACHGLADGDVVVGTLDPGPVAFREHGLAFGADVRRGQKTGHFLDQRENRALVRGLVADGADGAEVLDVFACTGGFSVYAAAGGARAVRSIDLAAPALAAARENMARNADLDAVRACDHTTEVGDAFDVLGAHVRRGDRWDLVVIDPPSFTPRRGTERRALAAYGQLTALGLRCTRPGGVFVQSSCSSRIDPDVFHAQLRAVADEERIGVRELARTGHALDHPASFPEARYLKTAFVRVLR